jgi:hypothetical protein
MGFSLFVGLRRKYMQVRRSSTRKEKRNAPKYARDETPMSRVLQAGAGLPSAHRPMVWGTSPEESHYQTRSTVKALLNSRAASRRGVVVGVAMTVLLAACGGGDGDKTAVAPGAVDQPGSTTSQPTGTSATSPTVAAPAGTASGTPSRKPCDLLTKKIAEETLGIPVGAAQEAPGEGNETCSYGAADTSQLARVYLTTYAVKGSVAVLDQAAAQFKNASAISGVGDAARVSIEDHAIGVLKGDLVFGAGLIPVSQGQTIAPVTKEQMATLASAVLAGM